MNWFKPWSRFRPSEKVDRGSASLDAFGRMRVCNPDTVFDSKLSYGKLPAFWDELISGTGASSTHVEVDSCVRMVVGADGDRVIRQTRQRWNYQPGKSQMILATFRMVPAVGVTARASEYREPRTSLPSGSNPSGALQHAMEASE